MEEDTDFLGVKLWIDSVVVKIFLLSPIILLILFGYYKILEGTALIIFILCCYILLFPLSICYIRFRGKRETQKRIEEKDFEEKVWLKSLRK